MNETMQVIHRRRSIRAYQERPVERETVNAIIQAAMRAPTAGNMMLYSIIEVADQTLKDKLAVSCDNQPFIATAPLVLVFLADYQRWFDYFLASDVEAFCEAEGTAMRSPGAGDLLLACCDTLIAAQTAVIAAEALGLGSCYIGDILERYEYHRQLLDLPQYVLPVTMLCIGYPTEGQLQRAYTGRLPQESIHFADRYRRLDREALLDLYKGQSRAGYRGMATNFGQAFYAQKFGSDFAVEMDRSVRKAIESWTAAK